MTFYVEGRLVAQADGALYILGIFKDLNLMGYSEMPGSSKHSLPCESLC